MTTLDPADHHYVMINTFTVLPENLELLVEELTVATNERFSHATGFVSANLHVGAGGRRVANYAQWRSREDFEAAMQDGPTREHIVRAAGIADSYDAQFYQLRESIASASPK